MKKLLLACFLFVLFGFTTLSHVGERAYYKVDTSSARTTQWITNGSLTFIVASLSSPTYQMRLDYDLFMKFPIGHQQGQKNFNLSENYFTPEFWAKLRKDKVYTSPSVKMKHEGYADVKTPEGRTYLNCDKVYMYDFNMTSEEFEELANVLVEYTDGQYKEHQIENLEIHAKIKDGIPSIRAATLDISGKMDGNPFILGADYIKNSF